MVGFLLGVATALIGGVVGAYLNSRINLDKYQLERKQSIIDRALNALDEGVSPPALDALVDRYLPTVAYRWSEYWRGEDPEPGLRLADEDEGEDDRHRRRHRYMQREILELDGKHEGFFEAWSGRVIIVLGFVMPALMARSQCIQHDQWGCSLVMFLPPTAWEVAVVDWWRGFDLWQLDIWAW